MSDIVCRNVTWDEVQAWSEEISDKVSQNGFQPDIVIGLTRGGWVPARIVCDYIGIKDLFSFKTEHWGVTATRDGKAELTHAPDIDMKGKKVLIVDDITDTGDSLKLAVDHVLSSGAAVVRTATMLNITHSKFTPDFYSQEVDRNNWAWFVFPWNYHEDMRNLIPKLMESPLNIDELKNIMFNEYYYSIDTEGLRKVLDRMKSLGIVREENSLWSKV